MPLITTNQYKLNKSLTEGWVTAGLNLAPADEARLATDRTDLPTLCPRAGAPALVGLRFKGARAKMYDAMTNGFVLEA